MRMEGHVRHRPGFSLIELLVAIVILSLVLGIVYQSFATISIHAERETARLAERQDLRMLLNLVANELQAVQHLKWFSEGGYGTGIRAETTLEGVKDFSRMDFHAAVAARFHRTVKRELDPTLHELGYSIRPAHPDGREGEGLVLVRREDFYVDDDMRAGGLSVVLADRISDFLIEYLASGDTVGTPQERWETTWDSETRTDEPLPLAIRVTVGRELAGPSQQEDEAPETVRETLEMNLMGTLEVE